MEVMPDKRAAAQQVNRMEIMPDKRFLAAAGNPHIRLFQIDSNQPQPVMSYDGHTKNVTAVSFQCVLPQSIPHSLCHNPFLPSLSHPPPLTVVPSSSPPPRPAPGDGHGLSVRITPTPSHYSSCPPRLAPLQLMSYSGHTDEAAVMSYDGHTNNVTAVGFQCDGRWMYSGSEDGTVKIWDLRAPLLYQRDYESRAAVNTVVLHPNQTDLIPIIVRDYESRAAVNTVVLHPNQTELISGDQNGNIRVWDLTANACSCELVPEVDTAIRSVAVMWDGSMVVAANNKGTCFVWRLTSGSQPCFHSPPYLLHSPPYLILRPSLCILPLTFCIVLFPVTTTHPPPPTRRGQTAASFEPLHKLQAHNSYVLKCLLSPEFSDPNSPPPSHHPQPPINPCVSTPFSGHARWVWDCVFSIDGAYLVSGLVAPLLSLAPTFTSAASSDSTSRLWALASGNSPLPFCTRCTSAASSDGTSRLWELASGNCVRVYQGHQKAVVCCALNDGTDLPPA
ncbi:unnamed protein product [Closterium sp. NIES-65]|nr:unnamed protein product [Closterium sp. NIES-65]